MAQNNQVLILGGGGFVGYHLAVHLLAHGYQTIRVDERPMQPLGIGDAIMIGDIGNADFIRPLFRHCHTIVHLVSATTPSSSTRSPRMETDGNLVPTLRLLELLQDADNIQHLVFLSSGGTVYGNPSRLPTPESDLAQPLSYHAAGKLALESFAHAYQHLTGKVVTILRPSNLYGPHQTLRSGFGVIRTMLDKVQTGLPLIVWGDGENVRDYLYIDDMISACHAVIARQCDNNTFNVGFGCGTSVNTLLQIVENIVGRRVNVEYHPARALDVRAITLDSSKLHAATGWSPSITLEEGIFRTWQWLNPN